MCTKMAALIFGLYAPVLFSSFGSAGNPGSAGSQNTSSQAQTACANLMGLKAKKKPLSFAVGRKPTSIAYALNGKWAAVTNPISHNITIFQIDQITGIFTEIPNSPCSVPDKAPTFVAYSDDNEWAATVNYLTEDLTVWKVDQTTGGFTKVQSIPTIHCNIIEIDEKGGRESFALGTIAYSANNMSAIIADNASKGAIAFPVDRATGMLNLSINSTVQGASCPPVERYSIVDGAQGNMLKIFNKALGKLIQVEGLPFKGQKAVCSTNGKWIFITGYAQNNKPQAIVFEVNQIEKKLVEVDSLPFVESETSPMIYSPDDRWVAIPNYSKNNIMILSVNSETGTLTQIESSPFATGKYPARVSYSPDNLCLAVANYDDGTVWIYEVDQETGALSRITGDKLQVVQKFEQAAKELMDKNLISIPDILSILREYMVAPKWMPPKSSTAVIEEEMSTQKNA